MPKRPLDLPSTLDTRGVSRREREVLAALAERLTNAEIASRLYLSERTVESHVSSLLRKLEASNRLELAALAKELRQTTATPGPTPLPSALALLSEPSHYVGRSAERARLDEAWQRATAGRTLVVVLAAEAGMGKSRLAAELAARVHAEGAQVLLGACLEEGRVPYEPFAQAVQADVKALTPAEVDRRVGNQRRALARLVPELAGPPGAEPDEVVDATSARAEVIAGVHGYLTRAATGPTLVVVEDVQWATATTLDALRRIARMGGPAPLLLVLTARDVAPDLEEALDVFLADLARLPTVERISLHGLAAHEVAELVEVLGSDADPSAVVAETSGNPLLVREVVSRSDPTLGRSLPGLLVRRYALLEEEDLAVLDIAAVLGATFDAEVVAAATGRSLDDALDSLDHAASAGLLVRDPVRPLSWSFVHALFRTARYEMIPTRRRLRSHHAVALALVDRAGDPRVLPELARHACIAAPVGDPRAAIALAVEAAAGAERSFALSEAADHHRQALEVAELLRPPDPALHLRLTIRFGELLQGAGDPRYREVLMGAARTARAAGDAQALAEVGWAMVRYGGPGIRGSEHPDLASITEDALGEIGPDPTAARARTLAVAAEELCFVDPPRAVRLAHEARAIARQLDDPVTLGHVLLSYRIAARTPDNLEARHPTADELIDIGRRTGQPTFTLLGMATRAWSAREAGNLVAADAALDGAIASSGDHTLPPTYVAGVALFRAARDALRGDLAAAERTAGTVLGMATDGFDPANWYGPSVVMLRHSQARLPELIPLLETAAQQPGIGGVYRSALAVAYAHAGRLAEASAIVHDQVAGDLCAISRDFTWLASLVALSEAAEITADAGAAGILAVALEPYRGRLADLPQAVIGPVDLALAQLALARGDLGEAEVAAARAVAASRERGTVIFLARELVRLAAAGVGRGEVEPLVAEALALADRTGALLIRREAERYGLTAPT